MDSRNSPHELLRELFNQTSHGLRYLSFRLTRDNRAFPKSIRISVT
ncbi:hypothetical protein BANT10_03468 [Brevibacterium antiquum]|uniref:Uncharacterized protein n=1 Tax=Brevibacterium antiquum TaxID=234835 RepID=A0A2H1KTC5_9MICO|nr:hypothetical protein BANT10_03468 [Brevibacterium antiquum]